MRIAALIAAATATLATHGCTWVEPDAGGSGVKVAYSSGAIANCVRLGEITVSVKASVAGIDRSETKVRDELESLARNEGATMNATHVYPVAEPLAGSQKFEAFDCR